MSNPNDELATRIVERLVVEKLLDDGEASKVASALAAGTLSEGEWRIALENTQGRSEREKAK